MQNWINGIYRWFSLFIPTIRRIAEENLSAKYPAWPERDKDNPRSTQLNTQKISMITIRILQDFENKYIKRHKPLFAADLQIFPILVLFLS